MSALRRLAKQVRHGNAECIRHGLEPRSARRGATGFPVRDGGLVDADNPRELALTESGGPAEIG